MLRGNPQIPTLALLSAAWLTLAAVPPAFGEPDPPAAPADPPPKTLIAADVARVQDGVTLAEGNISIRTPDITITADSAIIDPDHVAVQLIGNVVIGSKNMRTTATSLQVNLETAKWRASHCRTQIDPEFFGEGVEESIYVAGRTVHTPPDKDFIEGLGCSATSCSKHHPHYELRSKRIVVRPGKKVYFRKPSLYILGYRVFKYPMNLTLSLDGKENKIFPEIGQNEIEGYYAKFAYPYQLNYDNDGLLRLHLTEKRGVGLGFDHSLSADDQSGEFSLFWEPSEGALASRLAHRYTLSQELSSDLSSNYQHNSGYYGSNETLSNNLAFRRKGSHSNSQIGLLQSMSKSTYSTSRRFGASMTHQQRRGPDTNWSIRSTMRDTRYRADQPADKELDAQFEYRDRQDRYDWKLLADNRWDLDGARYAGDDNYRSLNRLPEFVIDSDTDRLMGWHPLGNTPVVTSIALGRFEQNPEDIQVGRLGLRFDYRPIRKRLTGNSTITTSARYHQSVYDQGSAQYVFGIRSEVRQEFSAHWTTRASLGYSSPDGFSPIRLDYWGTQKDFQFEVARLSPNRSRMNLSTGFDLINDRWRTILGQFEYMTSNSSKLAFQTGYDLERSVWRPLNARWTFAHPGEIYFTLGAQYDIDAAKLRQATFDFDFDLIPKTRLEFLGRYSGYTHRIDQMDVRITRDLHCWIGSLSYSKPTGEFQINLGLKAFPAIQTNFGTTRGASFQSGAGAHY